MSGTAELPLDYDARFERRMFGLHRAANVLGVLLMAAAIAGLFGEGPLAHASKSAGQLSVDYDRFVRTAASTFLHIQVPGHNGVARFSISNGYSNAMSIGQINPEPQSVRSLSDRTVYTVNVGQSGQVQVYVVPQKIGLQHGTVRAAGQRVDFRQFVYP